MGSNTQDYGPSFLLQKITPDVVIYELNLPHVPGYDFLAVVRTRFPQVAVIGLSSEAEMDGQVPHGVFADAIYVKGQNSPETLLQTVNGLLQTAPDRRVEHQRNALTAFTANQRARRKGAS